MDIVDERNKWQQTFEENYNNGLPIIDHKVLEEYRVNRDNPHWRISKNVEMLCEYILWLEQTRPSV